ncbi:MAG: chloride channel protein [Clostridia bacterium]|nr:chloride channel protein [Clostridia bacterium]
MEKTKSLIKSIGQYPLALFKWLGVSVIVGMAAGLIGSVFHIGIEHVTELRFHLPQLIYLLPLGGLLITFLYKLCKKFGKLDTNRVIESVKTENQVPLIMAPLIFVSTIITHLLGGSAGREGAALQLGGSIGNSVGKMLRLNKKDMHIVVMAGMSGAFSALFGTPLTAVVFALEVVTVGMMHYAALVPCLFSSIIAFSVASSFSVEPVRFSAIIFPALSAGIVLKVVILAVLCALVSILFCQTIKKGEHYVKVYIPNAYLRTLVGSALIVLLTLVLGTTDYNGAGMHVISEALRGNANYEAFLLKILFTAITLSAGFKGGEIVPVFFVGSTFGCVIGPLLGLDPGFAAAIGFVCLFCGVVNCPIASFILSIEVFGANGILLFALACAISYVMSGYTGLYTSQKILYSKLEATFIDQDTK